MSPRRGADRGTHRDLTTAGIGAREQEVDDVGAGDQQDDRDGAEQDEQRAADVAGDELLHRNRGPHEPEIAAFDHEPRGNPAIADDFELARGRARRDAAAEPGDTEVRAVAPLTEIGAIEDEREPELGRPRRPVVERELERRRHDPDDRPRTAVDEQDLTHETRRTAEATLPQAVTNHHRLWRARIAVGRDERSTQRRPDAQRCEQIAGHCRGADALGLVAAGQVRARFGIAANARRARRVLAVAHDLLPRQPGETAPRRRVPDHRELLGLGIRQRAEHHRLDQAEDRGVGANPQRERRDRRDREPGRLHQHAEPVTQVVEKLVDDGHTRSSW